MSRTFASTIDSLSTVRRSKPWRTKVVAPARLANHASATGARESRTTMCKAFTANLRVSGSMREPRGSVRHRGGQDSAMRMSARRPEGGWDRAECAKPPTKGLAEAGPASNPYVKVPTTPGGCRAKKGGGNDTGRLSEAPRSLPIIRGERPGFQTMGRVSRSRDAESRREEHYWMAPQARSALPCSTDTEANPSTGETCSGATVLMLILPLLGAVNVMTRALVPPAP